MEYRAEKSSGLYLPNGCGPKLKLNSDVLGAHDVRFDGRVFVIRGQAEGYFNDMTAKGPILTDDIPGETEFFDPPFISGRSFSLTNLLPPNPYGKKILLQIIDVRAIILDNGPQT